MISFLDPAQRIGTSVGKAEGLEVLGAREVSKRGDSSRRRLPYARFHGRQ